MRISDWSSDVCSSDLKGVKTALITTKGFRDVIEIARGNRPDLFNFNFRKPKPFVKRYLRTELDERVTFRGDIKRAVDLTPLPGLLDHFRRNGVDAKSGSESCREKVGPYWIT